jgi:hypothetical protein
MEPEKCVEAYRVILVRDLTGSRLNIELVNKNGLDEATFFNLVMLNYEGWEIGSIAYVK